jgi:hypothetical protein
MPTPNPSSDALLGSIGRVTGKGVSGDSQKTRMHLVQGSRQRVLASSIRSPGTAEFRAVKSRRVPILAQPEPLRPATQWLDYAAYIYMTDPLHFLLKPFAALTTLAGETVPRR